MLCSAKPATRKGLTVPRELSLCHARLRFYFRTGSLKFGHHACTPVWQCRRAHASSTRLRSSYARERGEIFRDPAVSGSKRT
jgi:hypothetical protein